MLLATGFKAIPHYIQALLAQYSTTHLWQKQGVAQSIKGLYVVGMPWQRSHASATIRGVGEDARFVVKHLQAYLKHAQPKKILQGCC